MCRWFILKEHKRPKLGSITRYCLSHSLPSVISCNHIFHTTLIVCTCHLFTLYVISSLFLSCYQYVLFMPFSVPPVGIVLLCMINRGIGDLQ